MKETKQKCMRHYVIFRFVSPNVDVDVDGRKFSNGRKVARMAPILIFFDEIEHAGLNFFLKNFVYAVARCKQIRKFTKNREKIRESVVASTSKLTKCKKNA